MFPAMGSADGFLVGFLSVTMIVALSFQRSRRRPLQSHRQSQSWPVRHLLTDYLTAYDAVDSCESFLCDLHGQLLQVCSSSVLRSRVTLFVLSGTSSFRRYFTMNATSCLIGLVIVLSAAYAAVYFVGECIPSDLSQHANIRTDVVRSNRIRNMHESEIFGPIPKP